MKFVLTLFLVFTSTILFSQRAAVLMGTIPEIAFSYRLNDRIKFNSKIESFHGFLSRLDDERYRWSHFHRGVNIQAFGSYRLDPFQSIAIGYQYGVEFDEFDSHRLIQQYSIVRKPLNIKFGHRFRSDQTFYRDETWMLRLRYRLSAEIPMQGQTIDQGEFYMVVSEEVLYALQSGESAFQNRLIGSVGHFFPNNDKLQLGLEYRLGFARIITAHGLWLRVSWFINLG
jgi:hypothetical protein